MRSRIAPTLLFVLPLAGSAGATDLELGLDVGASYNSNLFGASQDPESDYAGRFGPRLRLMDEVGSFVWDVRYWPSYEKYVDIGDADGWDHDLDARATWSPSRRTHVRFAERFLDSGNVNEVFSQDGIPDAPGDPVLEFGRDQVRTNSVSLAVDHMLAARHDVSLTLGRSDTRFSRQETENTVTALTGSYFYAWKPTDRVGLRLSGTDQEVASFGADPLSTRYVNVSLQWVHTFDPTMTLRASLGPTWTDQERAPIPRTLTVVRFPPRPFEAPSGQVVNLPTRASSCPRNGRGELIFSDECEALGADVLPALIANPEAFIGLVDVPRLGGEPSSGQSLTYFADIDLTKRWRNFVLTLAYGRDASTTSEISGVVLDSLSGYLTYTPSPRWSVSLQVRYWRRDQPTAGLLIERVVVPVTVGGVSDVAETTAFRVGTRERSLEISDYLAGIFVNYRLNEWTRLYFNFSYQYEEFVDEDLQRSAFPDANWDRFYVSVGVTYTLPRVHLPF